MGFLGEGTQPEVSPTLNGFLVLFLHKKRTVVSGVGLIADVGFYRYRENQLKINFIQKYTKKLYYKKIKFAV